MDYNPSGDLTIDLLTVLQQHPLGLTTATIADAVTQLARDRKGRHIDESLAFEREHNPYAVGMRIYIWPDPTNEAEVHAAIADLQAAHHDAPWLVVTNADWLRRRRHDRWHLTAAGYLGLMELTRAERDHQAVIARIRARKPAKAA